MKSLNSNNIKIPEFRSPDVRATMTPTEMANSRANDIGIQYAVHALSHPDDDTYRKNLAKYLDTKGFDLLHKNGELYMGDRVTGKTVPVTTSFLGDMIGSTPEILASIFGGIVAGTAGATGGAVAGDAVQQAINKYFLDEDLEPSQRAFEGAKSAGLSLGGEMLGNTLGRAITPLSGINKATQGTNERLASKYGIELTPASATGHRGLAQFEEVMQRGSLGGKNIANMKKDEISGVERLFSDLVNNKMKATGDTLDSGSTFAYNVQKRQKLAQDYFNDKYGDLVKAAGVTKIPVTSFKGVAKQITDRAEKIPAFKNGVDELSKRIISSPDSLSYEEYQQLRSFIGSKIKDASVTGHSGSVEAYKQLYKAINNDFDNVFKGTQFHETKKALDEQFKNQYKKYFEDSFTRGVLGSGKQQIDPERVGRLIARSSNKARTAANTADSKIMPMIGLNNNGKPTISTQLSLDKKGPLNSMSTAADYLLHKSTAPNGGISLAKARTNLRDAKGIDKLFSINKQLSGEDLKTIKDDLIKLIEISGQNKAVSNTSGTAYMNELIRLKNDPWSALIGFASDRAMDLTYKRKLFQKWLTNNLISKDEYRQLINAVSQSAVRSNQDR